MTRFFLLMLYLTSGFTARSITAALNLKQGCVAHITRAVGDVVCRDAFPNYPHVFAAVDASPIFINRPKRHQAHYFSGKYRRHCVKVQALVTPDGQCIHLSRVYRGATHDKAIFDRSEVAQFLTYQDERGRIQHKPIMGDLAYIGITRTCPGSVLPHKRPSGRDLTNDQKVENG
jgi:hypothetical protein